MPDYIVPRGTSGPIPEMAQFHIFKTVCKNVLGAQIHMDETSHLIVLNYYLPLSPASYRDQGLGGWWSGGVGPKKICLLYTVAGKF